MKFVGGRAFHCPSGLSFYTLASPLLFRSILKRALIYLDVGIGEGFT